MFFVNCLGWTLNRSDSPLGTRWTRRARGRVKAPLLHGHFLPGWTGSSQNKTTTRQSFGHVHRHYRSTSCISNPPPPPPTPPQHRHHQHSEFCFRDASFGLAIGTPNISITPLHDVCLNIDMILINLYWYYHSCLFGRMGWCQQNNLQPSAHCGPCTFTVPNLVTPATQWRAPRKESWYPPHRLDVPIFYSVGSASRSLPAYKGSKCPPSIHELMGPHKGSLSTLEAYRSASTLVVGVCLSKKGINF